jgi:hypothetical protein
MERNPKFLFDKAENPDSFLAPSCCILTSAAVASSCGTSLTGGGASLPLSAASRLRRRPRPSHSVQTLTYKTVLSRSRRLTHHPFKGTTLHRNKDRLITKNG